MSIQVLNDLSVHGSLIMAENNEEFPINAQVGTLLLKNQVLYAYIRIGGLETWYPFANKTRSYIHTQGIAALTWTVNHNLGTEDIWYQVKDTNGNIVMVGKDNVTNSSFQLTFTTPIVGTAIVVAPEDIEVPIVKASEIVVGGGNEVIINNSGITVNGSYVLTSANIETQINNAVLVEQTARIAADSTLQNNINAEITARTNADLAEQTARIAADSTLQNNINAEITARITGDSTLQNNINTEITARTNADLAEQTARIAGDSTLQNNIDTEVTARTDADDILQSFIDAEVLARVAADETLQANLDAEISARLSAAPSLPPADILVNVNTTNTVVLDASPPATYRSVKYIIQIKQGDYYQVSEVLVLNGLGIPYITEYAILVSNGILGTITATIDQATGDLLLNITMNSADSAKIVINKIGIQSPR